MKKFIVQKKQNVFLVIAMLILLCAFAITSVACGISDPETDESSVDYGTMTLSLPQFNSEDGENVLFAGYNGRKIKTDFSKPEYATDEIEWTVDEPYRNMVKVENGIVSATGDFTHPARVKIEAKSEHFSGELVLTVKNFDGEYQGKSLYLSAKTERLIDEMKANGVDGNIEDGGIVFMGDGYFDTKYFANAYSIYDGKVAKVVGICDTGVADWQYLVEKLVYPVNPDYVAVHIGANDLKEKEAEYVIDELYVLFDRLHSVLPDSSVFYFGIEPEMGLDRVATSAVNTAVSDYSDRKDWLTYIDSSEWCLDNSGEINADFYRDGVHPKLDNYYLYTDALDNLNISVKQSVSNGIPAGLLSIDEESIVNNSERMFGSVPAPNATTRARIQFNKPLAEGTTIKFNGDSKTLKWAVVTFEDPTRKTNYDSAWSIADNWKGNDNRLTYTLNGNLYVTLTVAYKDDRKIGNELLNEIYSLFDIYGEFQSDDQALAERSVISVNHRGFNTIAPENTLSAFELSAKNGFGYVECDVSFTKDNVPVILHDNTVNRTSNGSGEIGSFTFDEVRRLDFGSWKNSVYSGEKIPSLEEFIALCKKLDLQAYIELKTQGTTIEQVRIAYDIVKAAGMEKKVTWISFGADLLKAVYEIDPVARLGYVVNSIDDSVIHTYYELYNGENEVFIDCNVVNLNDRSVSMLKTMNIPLEVWTVDSGAVIAGLDKYISGFTSNCVHAQSVLKVVTGDREKALISVKANNGTVQLSKDFVLDGETIELRIIPDDGFILSSLIVNGENIVSSVKGDAVKILADAHTDIEAEFETLDNFVYLTYHIDGKADKRLVRKGTEYLYEEEPSKDDDGINYYSFVGWFADEKYTDEITSFIFDKDTDLYAKFEEYTYTFAINYSAVDIDNIFGEQLVAVTDYKGKVEWKKISGDDSVLVDENGKVTASAVGTAKIGLYVLGEQMGVCEVVARMADKDIVADFKGERTNVYHNIINGTRALLQSASRYIAGTKITLKTQYRGKYQWSVSQIYKLPAENGYLFDPGWNTSWKNGNNVYTTTENAYLGIVIAVKGNTNDTLPSGIEKELSSMFIVEGIKDSGYVSLSKFIVDNSIETIKVIGTKDAVTGGTVNNLRISIALKVKVGAGTGIRFNVHTKKYLFAVVELQSLQSFDKSTDTDSNWNSTWKTAEKLNYTVKKDCYLCLTVAVPGGKTPFTESALDMLEGFFDISYVEPTNA